MKAVYAASDADWAADLLTRRSTSGGCIDVGGCALYTYNRRQSVTEQSPGEAEYYAGASVVSESLLIQEVLRYVGIDLPLILQRDASAAIGTCRRQGVGKIPPPQYKTLVGAAAGPREEAEGREAG